MLDLTVLTLTHNEEKNLPYLIENLKGFTDKLVVLDSGSSDKTVMIANNFGARVYYRQFDNFSNQRKYLLNEIQVTTKWVLILDADEFLTDELKGEISNVIEQGEFDAFNIKRRFYWMGKWVKKGYYPTNLLRLGKVGMLDCDDRPINEHLICKSKNVGQLEYDFIDENHNGLTSWFSKHNNYSTREALVLFEKDETNYSFFGSQFERKRWIRVHIWNRLPVFIRPLIYLFYRLFIRLGVLDGPRVILYHFLHAFLYRCMIDAKYLEEKWKRK